MLHFIILDDDALHNKNANNRLQAIFKKYNIDASISLSTTKPREVTEYCSRFNTRNNVYLLDVDIQSSLNGIEVAEIIREQDVKAYIIFVSAHPEYVLPSLKARVFDYLIKPVSLDTLGKCVNSIYKNYVRINTESDPPLTIKSGFNVFNLYPDEITFLEKFGHVLVVHTISGKIESLETLDSIETKLDKKKFFRCHKSYMVNISQISKVDYLNNKVYLKNGEHCLVSKRLKKELKQVWELI